MVSDGRECERDRGMEAERGGGMGAVGRGGDGRVVHSFGVQGQMPARGKAQGK